MADQVNVYQNQAQVEHTINDRVSVYQNLAQVEHTINDRVSVYHAFAQVEHDGIPINLSQPGIWVCM